MTEQKNHLQLTITRVDGPLFDGPVEFVTLPGILGELTVLAHHEALISPLQSGTIRLRRADGQDEVFTIEGGVLEISDNQATVLL